MSKKDRFLSWTGFALALGLALALPGCGSGSGPTDPPTPTPTPTPQPIVRTSVLQAGGSLPRNFLGVVPFTTSSSGTIETTVDWTFASNHIIVYIARGNCTFEQAVANQCQFVASSETMTPKPRVLTVSGAAAGAYTLLIGNLGPTDESVAFQIVLITGPGFSAVLQRGVLASPTQVHRLIEGRDLR